MSPLFMRSTRVHVIDYSAHIKDIDVTKLPACARSGAELRKQFTEVRVEFPGSCIKWTASGQNDHTNFENLCTTRLAGGLTASEKRSLLMFYHVRLRDGQQAKRCNMFQSKRYAAVCIN